MIFLKNYLALSFVLFLVISFKSVDVPTRTCKIHFLKLICYTTEDFGMDGDEIYLTLNGRKLFNPESMREGKTLNMNNAGFAEINGDALLALYDEDGGSFDSDDLLGEHRVYCEEAQKGIRRATFTQDDANYELTYEVFYE